MDERKLKYAVLLFDENIDISKVIENIKSFSLEPTYLECYLPQAILEKHDVYNKLGGFRKWVIRQSINEETYNLRSAVINYIHNGGYYPFVLIYTKDCELGKYTLQNISDGIKNGLFFHYGKTQDGEVWLFPNDVLKYASSEGFDVREVALSQKDWICYEL